VAMRQEGEEDDMQALCFLCRHGDSPMGTALFGGVA
jgi:hypothetical protein